jgi:transcriptional regulator with XRE-family HTH domain
MRNRPYSFVRAHRRHWGLTQHELAMLLGVENAATVSRIERAVRTPTATAMLGCSILFGVPDAELFASLQESVEAVVANAAKGLYNGLLDKADPHSLRKREFLEAALQRITKAKSSNDI